MKKILVAVDDTKGSRAVVPVLRSMMLTPGEVILLHVERLQGRSVMIDMLSDSELSTLKESMKGTECKRAIDGRAGKVLAFYKKELEAFLPFPVKTVVREGHPGDEILKVADQEGVELILLGSNGKRGLNRLITGCVSKYVERRAKVAVFIAKGAERMETGKAGVTVPVTEFAGAR